MRLLHYIVALIPLIICSCRESDSGFRVNHPEKYEFDKEILCRVDSCIESAINEKIIPGAVISVVKGDDIIYLKSFGNRQTVPEIEPMTDNTIFDIASLSKCVGTTLSAMQLFENGTLSPEANVSDYISGFQGWRDPETNQITDITIQDLMTHTSGLAPEIVIADYYERFGSYDSANLEEYIATEVQRNFKPGTECLYSCVNFLTLQIIIEKVTGESLCDYLDKNVFSILGLKNTAYNPSQEMASNCAPTELQEDGLPLRGVVHDPTARLINKGNSGNAGLFSNAEDLSVIASAIMGYGETNGKRILSEQSVKQMISIPSDIDPAIGRTFGWDKSSPSSTIKGTGFSANTICHTGYTGTSMVIDMDNQVAIILLTNRVHPYDKGSVTSLRKAISDIVSQSIVK